MDSFRIDEIARRLFESVPPALLTMQKDLETNFRAVLRERLSKLDLVSRDEFDAQAKVLERTRSRLEALEARLATLEGSAAPSSGGKTPGTVACRAQVGLSAPQVQVEVSLASGLPGLCIVGLAATVVRESKERVRAALIHSGFEFPAGRITVSLSPADLPKEGGRFDLPIALGILLASGQLRAPAASAPGAWTRCEYYGELGLTGELNPVPGILPAAAQAQRHGHELIVPHANAAEACAAAPALARAAAHLLEVCAHLRGIAPLPLCAHARAGAHDPSAPPRANARLDLTDVRGQSLAKRALIIAAAGAHSLLMIGPPGSGKSMLAQRLPDLLPALSHDEALEVAAIAAVSTAGFDPAR